MVSRDIFYKSKFIRGQGRLRKKTAIDYKI